ncbi:hypothetical protein Tco_0303656 [Tanacetum coccineum]
MNHSDPSSRCWYITDLVKDEQLVLVDSYPAFELEGCLSGGVREGEGERVAEVFEVRTVVGERRHGSDMSNSDELRHTDNTTLVPPRLPDTLLQVYHRRRPTLGLLILPSVSPFPPTIRRTARISVLPIEPNLAERARISAINLDDYQLDPLTPPPSPSSLFSMAAYQRMIAKTDPT